MQGKEKTVINLANIITIIMTNIILLIRIILNLIELHLIEFN